MKLYERAGCTQSTVIFAVHFILASTTRYACLMYLRLWPLYPSHLTWAAKWLNLMVRDVRLSVSWITLALKELYWWTIGKGYFFLVLQSDVTLQLFGTTWSSEDNSFQFQINACCKIKSPVAVASDKNTRKTSPS